MRSLGPEHNPEYVTAMETYLVGDRAQALSVIEGLVKRYPDDPSLRLLLGNTKYSIGTLREASNEYEKALELRPDFPQVQFKLGVCYVRMGCLNKALSCFERNVEREEHLHVMAFYWLALIHSFLGNDEKAVGAFNRLRQESPESLLANYFLAQLFIKRCQHGKALELLDELLSSSPDFADAHYLRGLALMRLFRTGEAIQSFRTAADLNPSDPRARAYIEELVDVPSI